MTSRQTITVRLSESGLTYLDAAAVAHRRTRSDMLRIILADYAAANPLRSEQPAAAAPTSPRFTPAPKGGRR